MKRNVTPFIQIMLLALLSIGVIGCSSKAERQQDYYEKALAFYEAGNMKKASVEIKNALQIDGDFPDGRYLHALIYEKDKNWQQVWANLSLVVELDPNHIKGLTKLSQLLFVNGMYDEVSKNANTILSLDSENIDAQVLLGSVYAKTGELEKAIAISNKVLSKEPANVAAVSILTEVYRSREPELALETIEESIRHASDKAILHLMKIDLLVADNKIETAIAGFKRLLNEYPDNLFFHYRYISLLQEQDRIDEAERHLRNLVKAKPENDKLKLWLVDFVAKQRNLEQAEELLTLFLQQQPDMVEIEKALGKVYIKKNSLDEALQMYSNIAARHGSDNHGMDARNAMVRIYTEIGQKQKAQEILDLIFEEEPENTAALLTLAKLLLVEGDTKTAITHLRTITRNQSTATEALFLLARAHEQEGDNELALDNYKQLLAIEPTNSEALIRTAKLEIHFNNINSAQTLLESALEYDPSNQKASALLLSLYSSQKLWSKGHAFADKLVNKSDTAVYGYYIKGKLFLLQKQFEPAISSYKKCLTLNPNAVKPLTELSEAYASINKFNEGELYLKNHIKSNPEHLHAINLLGTLYKSQDANRAIKFYSAEIERLNENPALSTVPLLVSLAEIYAEAGKKESAIALYEQALDKSPNKEQIHILLATQYQNSEIYRSAERHYKLALNLNPSSLIAANNLAVLYLDKINTPDNVARALELAPIIEKGSHPVFLDTLGWILYHQGNTESAISLFKTALESKDAPPEVHYHLAKAYLKSGDARRALRAFRIASTKVDTPELNSEIEQQISTLDQNG